MDHVDHYGPYILPVAKNEALKPLQIRVWNTQIIPIFCLWLFINLFYTSFNLNRNVTLITHIKIKIIFKYKLTHVLYLSEWNEFH